MQLCWESLIFAPFKNSKRVKDVAQLRRHLFCHHIKDIILVGSNASYNYTKDSDLDIHIKVDLDNLECPSDLYALLYSAYRSIFNKNLDIDFYGIPVEIFVETV